MDRDHDTLHRGRAREVSSRSPHPHKRRNGINRHARPRRRRHGPARRSVARSTDPRPFRRKPVPDERCPPSPERRHPVARPSAGPSDPHACGPAGLRLHRGRAVDHQDPARFGKRAGRRRGRSGGRATDAPRAVDRGGTGGHAWIRPVPVAGQRGRATPPSAAAARPRATGRRAPAGLGRGDPRPPDRRRRPRCGGHRHGPARTAGRTRPDRPPHRDHPVGRDPQAHADRRPARRERPARPAPPRARHHRGVAAGPDHGPVDDRRNPPQRADTARRGALGTVLVRADPLELHRRLPAPTRPRDARPPG